MDKNEFIRKGQELYAVAIFYTVAQAGNGLSLDQVISVHSGQDDFGPWNLVESDVLLQAAIAWLQERNVMEVIDTGFAPPHFIVGDASPSVTEALEADRNGMFHYFKRLRGSKQWLSDNLRGVNQRAKEIGLSQEDYIKLESEWAPLPLDRSPELLKSATEKVEHTLDLMKGDNGFAAHHPAERSKAVHDLSAFIRHVREQIAISYQFVREGVISSLRRLISRFLDNAIGLAAKAALVAVAEWLARHGFDIRPH